jgi:hypothetical protein
MLNMSIKNPDSGFASPQTAKKTQNPAPQRVPMKSCALKQSKQTK